MQVKGRIVEWLVDIRRADVTQDVGDVLESEPNKIDIQLLRCATSNSTRLIDIKSSARFFM